MHKLYEVRKIIELTWEVEASRACEVGSKEEMSLLVRSGKKSEVCKFRGFEVINSRWMRCKKCRRVVRTSAASAELHRIYCQEK